MKLAITALLVLLVGTFNCHPLTGKSFIDDKSYFVNHVELRENGQYNLYWNYTETDITFKAVVKTTGWAGFGLSPNGGMYSSDVVLAWFSPDGTDHLVDAHVRSSGLHEPIIDTHLNWKKVFMQQENGYLTFIFTRKLIVCGQSHTGEINLDIQQTQPVIFAFGDDFKDDQRSFPSYHGSDNRGNKVLAILGSLNEVEADINESNARYSDFDVKTTLPEGIVTEYYCQMFKVPVEWNDKKQHIVRYDTIVSKENLKYLHHWLMYECEPSFESEYLATNPFPQPDTCLNGNNHWGPVQGHCKKISLAWATGGDLDVVLPKQYGYPVGGESATFKYFFMQLHYENPDKIPNIQHDTSLRLWYTEEYRPTEFGILTVGSQSHLLALMLPPKMESMRIDNICPKEFMNPMIEEMGGEMTIFAELPHTHLAGTGLFTKVLRNDKEVEHISNNKYYDSNYQYVNFKQDLVKLKKDDEIISSCIYNTKDRDGYTVGGLGTYDEMCLNFIWYYPPNPRFQQCLQNSDFNAWIKFFTEMAQRGDFDWTINSDQTFFEDTLNSLMASEKLTKNPVYTEQLFQNFYNTADRMAGADTSYGHFEKLYPAKDIERMSEDNDCLNRFW